MPSQADRIRRHDERADPKPGAADVASQIGRRAEPGASPGAPEDESGSVPQRYVQTSPHGEGGVLRLILPPRGPSI
jgi:hypothetical protein